MSQKGLARVHEKTFSWSACMLHQPSFSQRSISALDALNGRVGRAFFFGLVVVGNRGRLSCHPLCRQSFFSSASFLPRGLPSGFGLWMSYTTGFRTMMFREGRRTGFICARDGLGVRPAAFSLPAAGGLFLWLRHVSWPRAPCHGFFASFFSRRSSASFSLRLPLVFPPSSCASSSSRFLACFLVARVALVVDDFSAARGANAPRSPCVSFSACCSSFFFFVQLPALRSRLATVQFFLVFVLLLDFVSLHGQRY